MGKKISESPEETNKRLKAIGNRLEEERQERLGLTQQQLIEDANIQLRTYAYYVAGLRELNGGMLQSFMEKGIDVVYVLSGKRQPTQLTPQEIKMVEDSRRMDFDVLAAFQKTMHAMAHAQSVDIKPQSVSIQGDAAIVGQNLHGGQNLQGQYAQGVMYDNRLTVHAGTALSDAVREEKKSEKH